jgi:outer membrane lipoprotein-sorting protein
VLESFDQGGDKMRKIISLLLVLVVVLGCVGLAACGGDGGAVPENGGAETGNGNGDGNGGEEPSNGGEEPAGDSLTDILSLGAGITSVKYDSVVTNPGADTFTMHVWLKGNKAKTESEVSGGMGTVVSIMDSDAQVMYQYFPDQNMAYKMSYDQEMSTALTETQSIPQYNPTVLGTDTMDGKVCLVVEYSAGGETVKMWVWKEYGFTIRIERTSAEGTTVVELKNIDFSNIPDSAFELPPGVQIIEV